MARSEMREMTPCSRMSWRARSDAAVLAPATVHIASTTAIVTFARELIRRIDPSRPNPRANTPSAIGVVKSRASFRRRPTNPKGPRSASSGPARSPGAAITPQRTATTASARLIRAHRPPETRCAIDAMNPAHPIALTAAAMDKKADASAASVRLRKLASSHKNRRKYAAASSGTATPAP